MNLNILFWIAGAKQNSKGLCPIYVRITIAGKRTEISTNIFAKPKDWDDKKKRIKGSEEITKLQNQRITQFEAEINRIHLYLEQTRQTITGERIKKLLFQNPQKTFLEVYAEMLEQKELLINIEYTPRTIEIYQTNFNHCKAFLKKSKQEAIAITEVKTKFLKDYELYLKTIVKASHNYAVRILRNVKQVVEFAIVSEYIESNPLTAIKIKSKDYLKPRIYLTPEELQKIKDFDFQNPTFAKIKDLFLFQCYTGFSYSDLTSFKFKEHTVIHEGKKFISKKRDKKHTGTAQMLPLFNDALALLEKYSYQMPIISNQTYNRIIKEIATVVGISKNLTTHVARRTAAMYWLNDENLPFEIVAQMLGHETDKTTRKYYAEMLIKKIAKIFKDRK
jgi:integrase/recombinase XerD